MTNEQHRTGIARAVKLAGGQVALARELGVTQQAISNWLKNGYVPIRRVSEIEATFGIPRHDLIDPRIISVADPAAL